MQSTMATTTAVHQRCAVQHLRSAQRAYTCAANVATTQRSTHSQHRYRSARQPISAPAARRCHNRGYVTAISQVSAVDGFKYLVPTYARPEIVFESAKGVHMYDTEGKEYLDFAAGIAVNALGHSDEDWANAVKHSADTLAHVSNLFHTKPAVALAERLVKNSFADRVFFCNSGTEANEAAIKFARKWGNTVSNTGKKNKLVSFTNGFHGRTMGALSLTWNQAYQGPFAPLVPQTHCAPFNDTAQLKDFITGDTCAVIVEPIQGESGITPCQKDFLRELRALCNQHDALLVFDEVQCGLGRTGYLWAHEHPEFGVCPDIMTLAKPLANGLPIGAVLVKEKVAGVMKPGDHGSTFSGGPLVCSAACAVFDKVSRPAFLHNVRHTGDLLKKKLMGLQATYPDIVNEVRGYGLMLGMELNSNKVAAADVVGKARDKGLIVLTAGRNVVRIVPPLVIAPEHVAQAVDILDTCLAEVAEAAHKPQKVAATA